MNRTEQKVRIEVSSTSHPVGDAEPPDAESIPSAEDNPVSPHDVPDKEELSKADRIRIEDAATRYLLEETAGSADDWSTF